MLDNMLDHVLNPMSDYIIISVVTMALQTGINRIFDQNIYFLYNYFSIYILVLTSL